MQLEFWFARNAARQGKIMVAARNYSDRLRRPLRGTCEGDLKSGENGGYQEYEMKGGGQRSHSFSLPACVAVLLSGHEATRKKPFIFRSNRCYSGMLGTCGL